jgi:hypothetical protein
MLEADTGAQAPGGVFFYAHLNTEATRDFADISRRTQKRRVTCRKVCGGIKSLEIT